MYDGIQSAFPDVSFRQNVPEIVDDVEFKVVASFAQRIHSVQNTHDVLCVVVQCGDVQDLLFRSCSDVGLQRENIRVHHIPDHGLLFFRNGGHGGGNVVKEVLRDSGDMVGVTERIA